MYGLNDNFVLKINRAWAWLLKQPNFYKAKIAEKKFSGKTEEIIEKAKIIHTFKVMLKRDLMSDKNQTQYIQEHIVYNSASKVNASLTKAERAQAVMKMIPKKEPVTKLNKKIPINTDPKIIIGSSYTKKNNNG